MKEQLLEIAETPSFTRDARSLMTESEYDALINHLAISRGNGTIIPGTGGLRKMRCGLERKGQGKRGGARIVYYYHSDAIPLLLIACYAKNEKVDLSNDDKKVCMQLISDFRNSYLNCT